ncbi:hypothetical protein HI914_00191 [Erysiphe necator]|nr:hypothetical protein HI914_00191 [Erysiphe necator]
MTNLITGGLFWGIINASVRNTQAFLLNRVITSSIKRKGIMKLSKAFDKCQAQKDELSALFNKICFPPYLLHFYREDCDKKGGKLER